MHACLRGCCKTRVAPQFCLVFSCRSRGNWRNSRWIKGYRILKNKTSLSYKTLKPPSTLFRFMEDKFIKITYFSCFVLDNSFKNLCLMPSFYGMHYRISSTHFKVLSFCILKQLHVVKWGRFCKVKVPLNVVPAKSSRLSLFYWNTQVFFLV